MGLSPLPVTVYQDVLCAWSYLAELRLEALAPEFGADVDWTFRPFPLRVRSSCLTAEERAQWIQEIDRARLEPEGRALRTELWTQADCPSSSLRPLLAVEAAGLQGERPRRRMVRALHWAALEQGINVSRTDVLLELACAVSLEVDRFSTALNSARLRRLLLAEWNLARERGVTGVPTLVVAGRWMICGLREPGDYRRYLQMCIKRHAERQGAFARVLH